MENYKLIKLRSGESLIGDVKTVTDYKTILIDRPMYYRVISMMDQKNTINSDLLVFRNYNDFSIDDIVELPVDYIATILNPDKNIVNYYNLEKKKQDLPNPASLKDVLNDEFIDDPSMILPPEIIEQMLNGVDEVINMMEEPPQPKRKKKSKKIAPPSKNKVDPSWGNKYTDWPIDPHDLL